MFIRLDINGHSLSSDALQQMVKKKISQLKCSGAPSSADMEEGDVKQSREWEPYHDEVGGWLSKKRHIHPNLNPISQWKQVYLRFILQLFRYQKDYNVIYQTPWRSFSNAHKKKGLLVGHWHLRGIPEISKATLGLNFWLRWLEN